MPGRAVGIEVYHKVVPGQQVTQGRISLPALSDARRQVLQGGLELPRLVELVLGRGNRLVEASIEHGQHHAAQDEKATSAAHEVKSYELFSAHREFRVAHAACRVKRGAASRSRNLLAPFFRLVPTDQRG